MKKFILFGIFAGFCATAGASDYIVQEETNTATRVSADYDIVRYTDNGQRRCGATSSRHVSANRPCARGAVAAQPVKVKTHTEVIDHYQVYQPVTVYKPVGAYAERRVVPNKKPCNKCAY